MKIAYKVSSNVSKFLEPAGGVSHIDVVKDMPWTLTPKSGRVEVPQAFVREYQQAAGQLVASLIYLYKLGFKGLSFDGSLTPEQLYKYKYIATPTGFSYTFPYFNTKKCSRTTSFTDEQGNNPFDSIMQLGQSIIHGSGGSYAGGGIFTGLARTAAYAGSIGGAILGENGIVNKAIPGKLNLDLPREWSGTSEDDFVVSFDLFNTGTTDDIVNNRNLCFILAHQNTQSRRNAILTDPVCIYSLHIPDIVHFPACYIANLDITNLGNTRLVSNIFPKPKTIPEAYRISITFRSLLQPSRQIVQSEDIGKLVTAITEDQPLIDAINNKFKEIQQGVVNAAQSAANAITTPATPSPNPAPTP